MKNLNKFVLEKLKVNSKTKINKNDNIESKEIIDRMIYYFNIDPKDTTDKEEKKDYESLKNKIMEWVEFFKITDIEFACDVETFNEFIQYVNNKKHQNDIKKEYDTSYSLNEKCQELLENAVTLYQHYNTHLELKYNNDEMICISYKYGTIYCLNTNKK